MVSYQFIFCELSLSSSRALGGIVAGTRLDLFFSSAIHPVIARPRLRSAPRLPLWSSRHQNCLVGCLAVVK